MKLDTLINLAGHYDAYQETISTWVCGTVLVKEPGQVGSEDRHAVY
jgi:hypothetical protein